MEVFKKVTVKRNTWVVGDHGTILRLSGRAPPITKANGYRRVVYGPRYRWYIGVHRLVALAFVENPRPDIFAQVDHINRDRSDNRATNLRWVNFELNSLNKSVSPPGSLKRFGMLYSELTGRSGSGAIKF